MDRGQTADPFEVQWDPRPYIKQHDMTIVRTSEQLGISETGMYPMFRSGWVPLNMAKAIFTLAHETQWPFEGMQIRRRSRSLKSTVQVERLSRQFDTRWPEGGVPVNAGEPVKTPQLEAVVERPPAIEPSQPVNELLEHLKPFLQPPGTALDVMLDMCARVVADRNSYAARCAQLDRQLTAHTAHIERLEADLATAGQHIEQLDRQLVDARLKPVTPFATYKPEVVDAVRAKVVERQPVLTQYLDSLPKS